MIIYLKVQRLVTLRNIRRISYNKTIYKAWLNSLVGAEKVSSCREDFSISVWQIKNLVCAERKCSGAEKTIGAKQSLGVEQWKCSRYRASVKFSGCRVNPHKVTSNIVCAKNQYFNNVELLHYLKSQRFTRSELISLLPWIFWTIWEIRIMSW